MKTVYPTTEIPHLWAHATQHSARNAQGNVSFNGPPLYSYSTVIAYRVDASLFVVDVGSFSITTSRHQWRARQAIRGVGVGVIECKGLHGLDLSRERWESRLVAWLVAWLVQDANEKLAQAAAKKRESYVRSRLIRIVDERLLDALFIAARAPRQRSMKALVRSATALQNTLRADWARQARAYQPVAQPQRDYTAAIARWRSGKPGRLSTQAAAHPLLRLVGDVVETSWGARVPVSAARDLWASIAMVRGDEMRSASLASLLRGRGYRVGNYPVNELRADGSLVIGCHDIPVSEVDIIAGLL